MIEHILWVASTYGEGSLSRQRIAIVGHSHYLDPPDFYDFTVYVVSVVMGGKRLSFFTRIATWFGTQPSLAFSLLLPI
jgi:hypothetical protein